MKRLLKYCVSLVLILMVTQSVVAQSPKANNNFKQQFLGHFNYASRVLSLAKAMPADSYSWQPSEDVYTVAQVYTHIARYNFYYLESSLGIPLPEGVNLEEMESVTDKEKAVDVLKKSIEHVKSSIKNMPASKLSEETKMYGRTVNAQAVLMQLITHYSEHVGQAIAYARMNDIFPPWSR